MTVVVKIGGAVAAELPPLPKRAVIVHGAGPQISAEMARRGLEPRFVDGLRITDAQALAVVQQCLSEVNAALCTLIANSCPLLGVIEAQQLLELGLVGEPLPVVPPELAQALASGLIPVVAPWARQGWNVNADSAAAALAIALGASQLLFVTDVPGLLLDGEPLASINVAEAERLLPSLSGGIVPKLLAAIEASRAGVPAQIGVTAIVA